MLSEYEAFEKGISFRESPEFKNLVNFDSNLDKPYHRWYRFKEGFSSELVKRFIDEMNVTSSDHLIDCFSGCGTSVLTCEQNEINSTGIEINPFLKFLSDVKTRYYGDPEEIKISIKKLIHSEKRFRSVPPDLNTFKIGFTKPRLNALLDYKGEILNNGFPSEVKDVLLLGLSAILEDTSKLRKDGKALRIVKDKKSIPVRQLLSDKLNQMYRDISKYPHNPDFIPDIYERSAKDLTFLKNDKYKLAIFSPPYLNTFDYLEVYKMELWMLDFIRDHQHRMELREETIRSHVIVPLDLENLFDEPLLDSIAKKIKDKITWNNKIPIVIKCYFEDMYKVLDGVYDVLEEKGHCVIVVGNSSYAGVPIPTDSLLAKIGEKIGFEIEEIRIARHLRRSAQQYTEAKKNGMKYLRESVIVLKK
jgi:hypothetical protein